MGPKFDPSAVVDDELRVHGIEGLRVVDASIMPQMISANLNAATMMIGEKGADLIWDEWHRSYCHLSGTRRNTRCPFLSTAMLRFTTKRPGTANRCWLSRAGTQCNRCRPN